MADLKILIPQNGITLDDDKFITLTGDSGTTGIDISLVENTPGGSFESLTGFPLTNQSLPTSVKVGSKKSSINIPIEFPSVGEEVNSKKTYLLTVTGTNNAMMGPYAATHGELSSNDPNNFATMNFVQYKDPTIKIVASIDGRTWEFTTSYASPAVTQVGKALTYVDSLSWRNDSKGNTSVDFDIRITEDGGKTFSIIKEAPVGWDSNDDNDNKDSDFTQDSTDHGNIVEIHSLVPDISTATTGKLTGTIDFTKYGTKDVTFTIDLTSIFEDA